MGRGVCFSLLYLQTLALDLAPRRRLLHFPYWTFPMGVHVHLLSYVQSEHLMSLTSPPLHPSSTPLPAFSHLSGNPQRTCPCPAPEVMPLLPSLFSVPQPLQPFCSLTMPRLFPRQSLYLLQVYLCLAPSHLSGLCSNVTSWERSSLTTQVNLSPF